MRSWSFLIIGLGGVTYLTTLLGKKPIILFFLDKEAIPLASCIIAAVGVILFVLSFFIKKKAAKAGMESTDRPPADNGNG